MPGKRDFYADEYALRIGVLPRSPPLPKGRHSPSVPQSWKDSRISGVCTTQRIVVNVRQPKSFLDLFEGTSVCFEGR